MAERPFDIYPMKCTVVLTGEEGDYLTDCLKDSLKRNEAPICPSYLSNLLSCDEMYESCLNSFLNHSINCDKVVVYLDKGINVAQSNVIDFLLDIGYDIHYRHIE